MDGLHDFFFLICGLVVCFFGGSFGCGGGGGWDGGGGGGGWGGGGCGVCREDGRRRLDQYEAC